MKKLFLLTSAAGVLFLLVNCNSTKKAVAPPPPKMTFEANVKPLIMANCAPCHIPDKGGRKKAYDTFSPNVADIDNIIARIEKQPTERGFMPFRGANRLSDSVINVFKQWKADGLLEK